MCATSCTTGKIPKKNYVKKINTEKFSDTGPQIWWKSFANVQATRFVQ